MDKKIIFRMKKAMLIILAILVLSGNTFALGVSPGRTTIDFQPDTEKEVTFTVINSEGKDTRLNVYTEDDSGIVKIKDKEIEMKANERSKDITVKLKIPKEMKPGIYDIDIIVKQMPSELYPSPLFVEANIGVISTIRIRIPYPNKYVEMGDIEIRNARVNSTVKFIIPVINFGQQPIKKLQAKIILINPENKTIAEILSQETSLEPNRRTLLNAQWNSENLKQGVYGLEAIVTFDDETTGRTKSFTLGRLYIRLLKVETGNNYEFGGIAKLDMTLQSEWNEKIEEVFGELEIRDKDEQTVADIKTPSIDLMPYEQTVLSAYWDTAGQPEGRYFLNLKLRYEGIEQSIDMITDLFFNGLKTRILGTGEAIASTFSAKTLLPVAVVLLIVINIFVVGYYKRKSRKFKYKPPKNPLNPRNEPLYRPPENKPPQTSEQNNPPEIK